MTPPTAKKDSIDRFVDPSLALFPGVDRRDRGRRWTGSTCSRSASSARPREWWRGSD